MKTIVVSFAASLSYRAPHPERTAKRSLQSFDVEFRTWPSRGAMLTSIRMQEQGEPRYDHWRPVIKEATP